MHDGPDLNLKALYRKFIFILRAFNSSEKRPEAVLNEMSVVYDVFPTVVGPTKSACKDGSWNSTISAHLSGQIFAHLVI